MNELTHKSYNLEDKYQDQMQRYDSQYYNDIFEPVEKINKQDLGKSLGTNLTISNSPRLNQLKSENIRSP